MTSRTIGIADPAPDREAERAALRRRGWELPNGTCLWAVADEAGRLVGCGLEPDRAAADRAMLAARASLLPPRHPLTAPQAARLLGVADRTIRSWVRRGQLQPLPERHAGRRLYAVAEVLRCEAARRGAARHVTSLASPAAPPDLVARARAWIAATAA